MLKISFPQLGDYKVPISFLLKKCVNGSVYNPLPITKKTLELGSKYAPDSVCLPFKYNLGNFIESLNDGCNCLIQAGGGCRYGYYGEVQEKILRDLGYDFDFINISKNNKISPISLYKGLKKINNNLSFFRFCYYGIITLLMIEYMDNIDNYIRLNVGFEKKKNSFNDLKKEMLDVFSNNRGFFHLTKLFFRYKKLFKKIETNICDNCLKVGIIGELYTSMEGASSYYIEKELANMGIRVKRFTNASYLLYKKKILFKRILNKSKKYAKYHLGADGLDNVYRTIKLINNGYDGIIHIKPFGCTPEISAITIIQKVCNDNNFPIMFLSFDSQTSEEGIKTRLEAFYEMIKEKRDFND